MAEVKTDGTSANVYDPIKFAEAAKSISEKLLELGFTNIGVIALPLRERDGKMEGALIARVPVEGEYKMIAAGWVQEKLYFTPAGSGMEFTVYAGAAVYVEEEDDAV